METEKKRINLLYCSSDNNAYSGAFLCMVSLCKLLKEKFGVNVLVVLPYKGDGTQLLIDNNINYKIIKSKEWVVPQKCKLYNESNKFLKSILKNFLAIIRLVKLIKKEKIDIVHLNTIWTWVGGFSALLTKRPLVWHIREVLDRAFALKIAYFWGYSLINSATKILAISECVLNSYPKINKKKSVVVYDGLDNSKFYKPEHEIFTSSKTKMICCGAIYHQKGQLDLLQACKRLIDKGYDNWELKIYGRGEIERLEQFIAENNLKGFVSLEGARSNMQDYYALCDISIVPSHFEGFGRVLVESMLSGCCVVASNTGAIPEIVNDRETGLLFEVKNDEDLSEKLIWLIENKDKSKEIANKGRLYAFEHFSDLKNAQEVFDIYKNILKRY